MKFSGKVWSDHGTTWFNFGSIWVNRSAGRRSSCLLSPAIAIWFDCGLLAVVCCHLVTENVMKLLFLAFRYIAPGGRVCCAPHHSLFKMWSILPVNPTLFLQVSQRFFFGLSLTDEQSAKEMPAIAPLMFAANRHYLILRVTVIMLHTQNMCWYGCLCPSQ